MKLRRLIRNWLFESRSNLPNPDQWLMSAFGGPMTATGIRVNAETAMRLTAVYSAVRILAETVATLPLIVYRRIENDGKERATDYFLYRLLHDQPNEEQTSVEFREMLQGHLALRGNAYAQIDRKMGKPARLVPLHPDRVEVTRAKDGDLVYRVNPDSGSPYTLSRRQGGIMHVRGLSSDGAKGINPIELFRETIGLGLAYEEYSGRLFGNGANINGVLETPQAMSDEALSRFRTLWQKNYSGIGNAGKTAILEQGMKWQAIGIAPKDAEFIVSRRFQVTEIARIFRVPPHMLADLERATFSNIEHQSLEFIRDTIRPWLVRWEQALTRDLIPPEDRDEYFVEFLIDGLMRGDLKSRYDSYAIGRNNGWLSANDIRRLENMNPLPPEQGDVYLIPLNMIPAGTASPEPVVEPAAGKVVE
jgi:HK97 family phage portal protein